MIKVIIDFHTQNNSQQKPNWNYSLGISQVVIDGTLYNHENNELFIFKIK